MDLPFTDSHVSSSLLWLKDYSLFSSWSPCNTSTSHDTKICGGNLMKCFALNQQYFDNARFPNQVCVFHANF